MAEKLRRRALRVKGVLILARRVCALGDGPVARLRVFVTALLLGARWILGRPSAKLRRLDLSGPGAPRKIFVSDYGELQVLRDIVLDEEYEIAGIAPRTVLDLGANIGLASAWFRARFPDASVVAVEPDPATFSKLERNLGGEEGVRLVNVAVAAESGEAALFRPAGYSIASTLRAGAAEAGEAVPIPARSLDDLWAELGIEEVDLLKLDVEGAELEVLEGFTRLDRVRAIVGEAHPPLMSGPVEALFDRLAGFDVERQAEHDETITFVARRR